jgi:hypothetical protein
LSSGDRLNVPEHYMKSDAQLVRKFCSGSENCDGELVFFAIPHGRVEQFEVALNRCIAHDRLNCAKDGLYKLVFIGIAEFVERPKRVIPSLVRFERAKQLEDFVGQVFAASGVKTINVSFGISEGETGPVESRRTGDSSGCISRLVKRRPKVLNAPESMIGKPLRDIFRQFDLADSTNSVRVRLDELNIGVSVEESIMNSLEPSQVVFCQTDSVSRTPEWFSHSREMIQKSKNNPEYDNFKSLLQQVISTPHDQEGFGCGEKTKT